MVDSLKNIEGNLELLRKYLTKFSLWNFYPKRRIPTLFVVFIKQVIEVLEAYLSYFLHGICYKVNKMPTFQKRTVIATGLFPKQFFNHVKMMQNIRYPQLLNPFIKAFLVPQKSVQTDKNVIYVAIRRLDTK